MESSNHETLHAPSPLPHHKKLWDWEEKWQTEVEPGEKETEFRRKGQTNRK